MRARAYHIGYTIIIAIGYGKHGRDIAQRQFAAAGPRARGRRQWRRAGCRWPSGAMWGVLQAILFVAFFS